MGLGRPRAILHAGDVGNLGCRGRRLEEVMRICALGCLLRRVGLGLIWGRVLGEGGRRFVWRVCRWEAGGTSQAIN